MSYSFYIFLFINYSLNPKTPKKRGRKPKNKKLDEEPKEKKIPKKRGRKPKEVVTNQKHVIKEEPDYSTSSQRE